MIQVPDEIKELLHLDTCKKNIRIHFPNGERSDICNDLIVKDSVSFTESLCSQDTLKFGLCEASKFECETVGVGNVKGARIEVSCEVYCDSSVEDAVWQMDLQAWVYAIPYGTFVIDEAKRQADLNHRKIVAYGGISGKGWEITDFEENKWLKSTNYNPNMGFFITANGFDVTADMVDETEISWSNTQEVGYMLPYTQPIPNLRLFVNVKADALCWSNQSVYRYNNRTDFTSNNLFRIDAKYNPIEPIQKQILDSLAPYNDELVQEDINKALYGWMHFYTIMTQMSSNVGYAKEYQLDNEFFYPYATSFYNTTSGFHGETILYIPKRLIITVYDNVRQESVDEIEIDNLMEYARAYKRTYKSAFSLFSDLNYYFTEAEPDDAFGGVAEYNPNFKDFDLQDNASAFVELRGIFGNVDRYNQTRLINIKQQFGLLPNTTLYPSGSLYPQGVTGGKLFPNDYQSCWYDDDYTLPYGMIRCQYKNTNSKDKVLNLYFGGFTTGSPINTYRVYDLSNNAIIKAYQWTAATIRALCQIIAANILGVTYMPVDFAGRGLPYVESGDTFEILTKSNDSITTIVLNRTLTGEQTLKDSYKSV